jgi:nitroreductase/NAD-dependent dihydropyrimidine dehydrogenase PreA subunit
MSKAISINQTTCKRCLLCAEVCPNKILIKNISGEIGIRSEREGTCFKCGQCMAVCETKSIVIDGMSYESDFFELPQNEPGSLEKPFNDLILTRRAIRNFKDKPVPRDMLEKVVAAVSFAPPGFPPLKTKLIVVQNKQVIRQALPFMINFYERLLGMMRNPVVRLFIRKEAGSKKFRTMQDHLIPLLISRLPALKDGTEDTLTRNAPAMILFIADKNGEDINQDISIAATYGMLAAHSLGLGGSIMDIIPPAINKDPELRKLFGITHNQEVVTSIILGFPRYKYRRGIKRNLKDVRWITADPEGDTSS